MVKANWRKLDIPEPQVGVHTWSDEYAAFVHEGTMSPSGVETPARPWAANALDDYDFDAKYTEVFQETGSFREAFLAASQGYGELAQQYLTDQIWDWPRATARKNGEVVTSPRDIVDTGALRDSYKYEVIEGGQ
jgi:hypothetical protein